MVIKSRISIDLYFLFLFKIFEHGHGVGNFCDKSLWRLRKWNIFWQGYGFFSIFFLTLLDFLFSFFPLYTLHSRGAVSVQSLDVRRFLLFQMLYPSRKVLCSTPRRPFRPDLCLGTIFWFDWVGSRSLRGFGRENWSYWSILLLQLGFHMISDNWFRTSVLFGDQRSGRLRKGEGITCLARGLWWSGILSLNKLSVNSGI